MICPKCKRSEEECTLVEGVFDGEILKICTTCAKKENIPLIKKPTEAQLRAAEEVNYSVRERMEKLSGKKNPSVTPEQVIAHKNLAKLRFPEKRQEHESLIDNYDWKLKTARRRRKLTTGGLATVSGVSETDIITLEKGQLVPSLEEVVVKLEMALNVNLLKSPEVRIKFTIPEKSREEEEHDILNKVSEKITEVKQQKKEGLFRKIASGKFDFSKRENIEDITLNDLTEIKKLREKNELFGSDDIELEEDND